MRSVARIKLGYYPLPPTEGDRLRRILRYRSETTSALDPCAGIAAALLQLTEGANVERHAIELDADRADACQQAGVSTVHGLELLEAGGDFVDGIMPHEGTWLGGETFASFDKKAISLLSKLGKPTQLLP